MSDDLITYLRALAAARPKDVSEVDYLWSVYAASCEAGDLLRAEVERLRAALRWYGDPANHYTIPPKTSYDPAYIFVAEPPIFQDSGRRARKALRGEGR
jgi:hypothetical protein